MLAGVPRRVAEAEAPGRGDVGPGAAAAGGAGRSQSLRMHSSVVSAVGQTLQGWPLDDLEEVGGCAGVGAAGNSDSYMLSALALVLHGPAGRGKQHAVPEKAGPARPNIVVPTVFRAAWEKLFVRLDVQPQFVAASSKTMTVDPTKIANVVDDKTIGVICITGNCK